MKSPHVLSVKDFEQADVEQIFSLAERLEPYMARKKGTKLLDGAILGSLFFEPSTRTRLSFGCAFNLLGGHVREIADMDQSSMVKGESVYDTARVISGYSDVIVMRHSISNAVHEFAAVSRVPVINAGDGDNEHPSQALLDLYTIQKEISYRHQDTSCSYLNGLRIAMIGDLRFGRAVHSLCRLLCLYENITVALISPPELKLPENIQEALERAGHKVTLYENLSEGIKHVDIAYSTRLQEERFASPEEAKLYRGRYHLDKAIYTRYCDPNTVIMHPLPRDSRVVGGEIATDLNTHPNLAIFRQTDNGVVIRMALFVMLFDLEKQLEASSYNIKWTRQERNLKLP